MISKRTSKKRIALIDGDFLIWVAIYPKKTVSEDGTKNYEEKTLEEAKEDFDKFLNQILNTTDATDYLGFISDKSFRHEINPNYKAQRSKGKPNHFKEMKEYALTKFELIKDLEADDCVRIYKKRLKDSFIVSNDKDVLMLEGKHFNPQKQEWIETTKEKAELFFWTSMITGDTVDNIKGIPKKGIKYAKELLTSPPYREKVFNAYVEHLGEREGIEWFYKNYMCLSILEDWEVPTIDE